MVFNSLTFLVFFAVVLTGYYTVKNFKTQKLILLIASYLFYAAWNPPFVLLLVFSTILDWYTGKMVFEATSNKKKNFGLTLCLIGDLGPLIYFKYGTFMLENFHYLMNALGIHVTLAESSIILPVGISFYTFQTMSYTLDIYRGKMKPNKSFLDFALYVTFFPQLVAGPIVRAIDFLPQLETPQRADSKQFFWGLYLLTIGLFQKVVLADVFMAPAADAVFNFNKGPLAFLDAWVGTLAFAGQIFFDFNGYSLCAIGISLCLGFHIMDNFNFPYASIGFSDFWRRWHISLSTFLRDYLYVPLGGNRGSKFKTIRNLIITMLLGGLWHGANWTFVVWGLLHGFYLMIERVLKGLFPHKIFSKNRGAKLILWFLTMIGINISWVFFRVKTLSAANLILLVLFGIIPDGAKILPTIEIIKVLGVFVSLVLIHWHLREKSVEHFKLNLPSVVIVITWAIMLFMIAIAQGDGNAFIYFQF